MNSETQLSKLNGAREIKPIHQDASTQPTRQKTGEPMKEFATAREGMMELGVRLKFDPQATLESVIEVFLDCAGGITYRPSRAGTLDAIVGVENLVDYGLLRDRLDELVAAEHIYSPACFEDRRNSRPLIILPKYRNTESPDAARKPLYLGEKLRSVIAALEEATGCRTRTFSVLGAWVDPSGKTVLDESTMVEVPTVAGNVDIVRDFVTGLFHDPDCDQQSFYLSQYGRAEYVCRPQREESIRLHPADHEVQRLAS